MPIPISSTTINNNQLDKYKNQMIDQNSENCQRYYTQQKFIKEKHK